MHSEPLSDEYSLVDRVQALLEKYSDEEWDAAAIAEVLDWDKVKVGPALATLFKKDRILKVQIGVYMANPDTDPITIDEDEGDDVEQLDDDAPLTDRVMAVMRARPDDVVHQFDDLLDTVGGTAASLMHALDLLKVGLLVVKVSRGQYQLRSGALA